MFTCTCKCKCFHTILQAPIRGCATDLCRGGYKFDLWCSSHKLPIEVVKSHVWSNLLLLKTLFNHTPALRQRCPLWELTEWVKRCPLFQHQRQWQRTLWDYHGYKMEKRLALMSHPLCDSLLHPLLIRTNSALSAVAKSWLWIPARETHRDDTAAEHAPGTWWCRCVSAHSRVWVNILVSGECECADCSCFQLCWTVIVSVSDSLAVAGWNICNVSSKMPLSVFIYHVSIC